MREEAVTKKAEENSSALPLSESHVEALHQKVDAVERLIKSWQRLARKAAKTEGKVPMPQVLLKQLKKRKRQDPPSKSQGQRKRGSRRLSDQRWSSSDESDEEEQFVTAESIEAQLSTAQDERERLVGELEQAQATHDNLQRTLDCLREEQQSLSTERVALCIQLRNDYSREAIRNDFAAGIQE